MGFAVLLNRGVEAVLSERASLDAAIGAPRAEAAVAALVRLPAVLEALNELAWSASASPRARAALTVVMAYGLRTKNLIPAQGDALVYGLLDDAYLAFFAAGELAEPLAGFDHAEVSRHRAALAATLPAGVVSQLEGQATTALDEIESYAKEA